MKAQEKKLNLLGLAQRASKLVSGDELVEKGVKQGKVKLIILGKDASDNTLSRYRRLATTYDVPLCEEFNHIEISQALGKKRTIVAITDQGMTDKFLSYDRKDEGQLQ